MTIALRSLARDLSRIELALAVVLIAVLVALFLRRMERVEALMERTTVQLVVQDLQARLLMYRAELTAKPAPDALAALVGANPVGTIIPALASYAGERERIDWNEIRPGQWAFERSTGTLGYRVMHARDLDGGEGLRPARLRYRLEPIYDDLDRDGRYDPARDRLYGIRFARLDRGHWREE
ncbi:MAG: hypothetical protein IT495_11100 [Gammaproteobacteria bacterium]|nr:hypothetical protein [Gammaproteobacteria bacterium]